MKNTLLSLTLLFCLMAFSVEAQGIRFRQGTWAAVQAQAQAENKYIFVDVFATWCGPCKYLSEDIFTQKEVGDFFNKHFVNYKIDGEKEEGPLFNLKYNVRAYPTLLYFNPQGELVHKTVGAGSAKKILSYGAAALKPETQLFALHKQFKEGNLEGELLKNYTEALEAAYEKCSEPATMYLLAQDKATWTSKENWEFIRKYISSSSSEVFEYIFEHQDEFLAAKVESESELKLYITLLLKDDIRNVARAKDSAQLEALKLKLKKHFGEEGEAYTAQLEYLFYKDDKYKAEQYTYQYFDKHCENSGELRQIAQEFYQKYKDKLHLEKALRWSRKSVKLYKTSENTLLQAQILYKLQRYQEALDMANVSIGISEGFKQEAKEAKKLAQEIKAKM